MIYNMKKVTKWILALVLLPAFLVACEQKDNKAVKKEPKCDDDLVGLNVAVFSGTCYDIDLTQRGDITLFRFNSLPDCLEALSSGKVDAYMDDESSFSPSELKRRKLHAAYYGNDYDDVAFGFRKGDKLCDEFNEFFQELTDVGLFDEIKKRWLETDEPEIVEMPDIPTYTTGDPIRVGTMQLLAPFNFLVGNRWHGFEAELLYRFAAYLKRPIDIKAYECSAGPAALQANQIDIFGGSLSVTEERKLVMSFGATYYQCHPIILVRDDESQAGESSEDLSFIDSIKDSFYRNFIFEDRYNFLLEGLWETIVISFFSLIVGTILAALLCWMRMSKRRILRVFAAYVCEMFRSSILALGKGQVEAGIALGFTPMQTFFYIIAPQAIRNVMPVYKGEAVSLFKSTSIVGYIAIVDLTKASDLVRSRTFDAFFPLIVIAIIYFVLAWLLGKFLDRLVKVKKHKTA